MNTLNEIEKMQRRLAELHDLEQLRADKLELTQQVAELSLILTQCKEALEQCAPKNGTAGTLRRNVLKRVRNHFGIEEDAA